MAAARTGSARVARRHGNEVAAVPRQLVVQLTAKLEPALIENGLVQARLGPNVSSRCIYRACRRLGHVPHLQVLDTHHRVVLADRGGALVQVVAAGIADTGVNALDAGFRLLPVVAEFGFATQRLLRFAQGGFMPLDAVKRRVERAVRECGKAGHAHVDADRTALRDGLFNLAFSLNAHEPLAARLAHGDVLHRAHHAPAVAVAQPAKFGQKKAAVGLVELDLFRVWVTEAVGLAFLLEAREVCPLGEEVGIGPLQVLEGLLQWMHGRIGQPCRFRAVTPFGEQPAQTCVAELLLALLVALFLQRQRLVEHEPARASEAAHLPLLMAAWHQCELEGLKSFHGSIILLVYER